MNNEYEVGNLEVERCIRAKYSSIVSDGGTPLIIDAGANIGLAALWFKEQYPKATIVSIEPDAENFKLLKENVGSSQDHRLMYAAVGAVRGSASVIGAEGLGWAVQTERSDDGAIEIVTINDAIALVPNGVPLIVKIDIDIEGFESDLFETNLEWLSDVHAVFIEPHDWMIPSGDTSRTFQKAFGERDFNLYLRGENLLYVRRTSHDLEAIAG